MHRRIRSSNDWELRKVLNQINTEAVNQQLSIPKAGQGKGTPRFFSNCQIPEETDQQIQNETSPTGNPFEEERKIDKSKKEFERGFDCFVEEEEDEINLVGFPRNSEAVHNFGAFTMKLDSNKRKPSSGRPAPFEPEQSDCLPKAPPSQEAIKKILGKPQYSLKLKKIEEAFAESNSQKKSSGDREKEMKKWGKASQVYKEETKKGHKRHKSEKIEIKKLLGAGELKKSHLSLRRKSKEKNGLSSQKNEKFEGDNAMTQAKHKEEKAVWSLMGRLSQMEKTLAKIREKSDRVEAENRLLRNDVEFLSKQSEYTDMVKDFFLMERMTLKDFPFCLNNNFPKGR